MKAISPPGKVPATSATALKTFQEAMEPEGDPPSPESKPARSKVTDAQISAALQVSNGLLTPAAKVLGLSRAKLAKLLKPTHQALILDLKESITDAAEAQLFRMVQLGDERSVQFWLTRQGKNRGYSEKQEIKVESVNALDTKARAESIKRLFKDFDQEAKA